jgi:UDP-glucose 4-epimerase
LNNILITGGAGFIGSYLAETMLKSGHEVCVLDDLSTGSLENISHLKDDPHFHFVLGSIMDQKELDGLVSQCSQVFHLAAVVGVKLVFERPVHTITVNVRGTENVLKSCLSFAKKVLIASTSEVYGKDVNSLSGKFKEDDDLSLGTSLRWGYACSKALDEYLARAYHREMGLPVVIARIFNTVGPRQSNAYGMVIPRLVSQALEGQPITVYGDGRQTRSFIWVEDTVRALIDLMASPSALGQIFNVGSEDAITINELAAKVQEKTQTASRVVHLTYEEAYGKHFEDIKFRVPDTRKIQSLIGFTPTLGLDEILERIVDFHKGKKAPAF